jgi:hypothetical protein
MSAGHLRRRGAVSPVTYFTLESARGRHQIPADQGERGGVGVASLTAILFSEALPVDHFHPDA